MRSAVLPDNVHRSVSDPRPKCRRRKEAHETLFNARPDVFCKNAFCKATPGQRERPQAAAWRHDAAIFCRARRRRVLKSRTRAPSERVPKHQALQAAERRSCASGRRFRREAVEAVKPERSSVMSFVFPRFSAGKWGRGMLAKSGFFSYTPQFQRAIMQPRRRSVVCSGHFRKRAPEVPFAGKEVCRKRPVAGVRQMRHPAAVTFQKNKF